MFLCSLLVNLPGATVPYFPFIKFLWNLNFLVGRFFFYFAYIYFCLFLRVCGVKGRGVECVHVCAGVLVCKHHDLLFQEWAICNYYVLKLQASRARNTHILLKNPHLYHSQIVQTLHVEPRLISWAFCTLRQSSTSWISRVFSLPFVRYGLIILIIKIISSNLFYELKFIFDYL